MKKVMFGAFCAALLSGCATTKQYTGTPVRLDDLIRQIKSDMGQYNAYAAAHTADAPLNTACGGKVNLAIKAITVSVTTAAKITQGVTAGAEVTPFRFLKAGASASEGGEFGNSQVLTFTVVPATRPTAGGNGNFSATTTAQPAIEGATITSALEAKPPSQLYSVLTNLRESLLKASDTTPCLTFPKEEQDNSVEFGFAATYSQTTGGAINLFVFSLGATKTKERTAAHTIKVAFEAEPGARAVER